MNVDRGSKIADVLKEVSQLSKSIKIPTLRPGAPVAEAKNAIAVPVAGSGFVRILMYFIAGLLLIGILLLGVDQWITPIFQRSPGSPGYISIPGNDMTQVFWPNLKEVADITVGAIPSTPPNGTPPLIVGVLEGTGSYSITMDVCIKNEYPQDLGSGPTQFRTFFILGSSVELPKLQVSLDNYQNKVYITCLDSSGTQQSVQLDNVPIHIPFRVGIVVTPYSLEGYLNGKLVQTTQINKISVAPIYGDKIFRTSNIKKTNTEVTPNVTTVLSTHIKVLNVRAFGYAAPATEMVARMSDLLPASSFP